MGKNSQNLFDAAPEMYALLNKIFMYFSMHHFDEKLMLEIDELLCRIEGSPIPGGGD